MTLTPSGEAQPSASDWFNHVQAKNPYAHALFVSSTRADFLNAAERLIEEVVGRMEARRATYRKLNEPDLSKLMVELLGNLVPAKAEADNNGHVDVMICHPRDLGFKHMTECKIWGGQAWHCHGMKQILHYTSGKEERAMCLAFVHLADMVGLLGKVRETLGPTSNPATVADTVKHPFLPEAFITTHMHTSGYRIGIVHFCCNLCD